jgi:sugar phosphate isomerase/epimerase
MESGTRFEDLVSQFAENGFCQLEIRDGDYLQKSEFGDFIGQIQNAMDRYEDNQWRQICDEIHESDNWTQMVKTEDRPLWDRVYDFIRITKDVVFSYAMSHPWLGMPENADRDDVCIRKALKLAYLLCPQNARLRLVDLESAGDLDGDAPVSNLKRYDSLLPDYPVVLAVENAKRSATLILELARKGNAQLAYDEANIYQLDGTPFNTPDEFWQTIKKEDLISVHLKQKTTAGVLSKLGDGFVNFRSLFKYLGEIDYDGDWLFENIPSDQPLMDAIQSRDFINELC